MSEERQIERVAYALFGFLAGGITFTVAGKMPEWWVVVLAVAALVYAATLPTRRRTRSGQRSPDQTEKA